MSWKDEVDQIAWRKKRALELGGADAVERHHERGKLTVRERVAALIDSDSWVEEGPQAGYAEIDDAGRPVAFQPANYVLGRGRIDGRPCVVGGEDFTQRGGSPTPAGLRKSIYSEDLALQLRRPLVRLLEGGGGSVTGSAGKGKERPLGDPVYERARFLSIARLLDVAPVVSIACGAVAGFPAARLVASHLSIMNRATSQVLIAGPAVVERALGERRTKEELGGPDVHGANGVADLVVEDEQEALSATRRFLGYLPTSAAEAPPVQRGDDDPERRIEELLEAVPRDRRRLYDMRGIVRRVVDRGSWMELSPGFGGSQVTGLARCGGRPVAILANDPKVLGGAMDAAGAQKVRRFIDFCSTFHLPIVSLVDEPGFLIGSGSERSGTIRYGMEAIAAVVRSRVPWISVIVRRAYGVAAAAHFGPQGRVLSWPSADTGALPVEGGVAVAFRREIAAADDPDAKRRELEEQFASRRTPFPRAESFSVHDLIDPRDTRVEIHRWLDAVWSQVDDEALIVRLRLARERY